MRPMHFIVTAACFKAPGPTPNRIVRDILAAFVAFLQRFELWSALSENKASSKKTGQMPLQIVLFANRFVCFLFLFLKLVDVCLLLLFLLQQLGRSVVVVLVVLFLLLFAAVVVVADVVLVLGKFRDWRPA